MPILLNLVYLLLLIAASPVLVWRCLARGKYRDGWAQKFLGRLPVRSTDRPVLWFHAVSVGEVLLLQPVLKEMRLHRGDVHVVISTTTHTGQGVAREKFPDCEIVYFPLDFSWSVKHALARVQPDLVVLVELELWPNFILEAQRRNIPLALINGRLSEKSHRGYRRLLPLTRRLLSAFRCLAAQSPEYAERFRDLGAPPEIVHVTGSVKFDQVAGNRELPLTAELRRFFGLSTSETVFIAGSTQDPEESLALAAYQTLKPRFPALRLILVPRHKERFEEVAARVRDLRLPLLRRSAPSPAAAESHPAEAVLLLDTLGELGACWGLADIAFVGGSLTRRGGQNMIEPAAYGAAVLFGPNTWNFRDVVQLLLGGDAARVVRSGEELTAALAGFLADPESGRRMGRRARDLVATQQGATLKTVEFLLPALNAATADDPPLTKAA